MLLWRPNPQVYGSISRVYDSILRVYDSILRVYDSILRVYDSISHVYDVVLRVYAILRVYDAQIAHLEVKISLEISSGGYMIEVSLHHLSD